MLDPTTVRIMLLEFALGYRNGVRCGIEQDRTCRCRALIDRQDMISLRHASTIRSGGPPRKGFSLLGYNPIRLQDAFV